MSKLNIRCFRITPEIHNGRQSPNYRHCDGIRYSLEQLGFNHDGIVLMIDSDMILIKPFSIAKYTKNFDFIGIDQTRSNSAITIRYSGPQIVFIDMRKLSNKKSLCFDCGIFEGLSCDVGGATHYYFKNNPHANIKLLPVDSTYQLSLKGKKCT